ncbi:hypothetical protein SAMN05444372_102243 [Flavobacterium micromati]|uniref:Acetyltransferase (GNAT) domain-containing protein n=1 Tax=Flavobacterium micromati TaxID=229205 RepID=A0A1M5H1U6_9FLAO|nr:FemAB family protein [Flavobacterium micromati]SHG09702.1 hypothetical protein SAMN05444372_102243 [Flavobacterium micromati]
MKNYFVKQYQQSDYLKWNDFVSEAKNATFLFHRDFMEYHKDRFDDFSLMVYDNQKLIAVLPANRVGSTIYSHQGLTYGGLVYLKKTNGEVIGTILDTILSYLSNNDFSAFYFKPIPSFYFPIGNSEIDFFLLKKGAYLDRKEMNLAVNLSQPLTISKSKLKHFRRVEELDLEIIEEQNFDSFWNLVLQPRLLKKHNAKPVHSLLEIAKLKKSFPENIKQFSVYHENDIVAGITIFESESVIKSQYGATTEKGERLRALDYLLINLIRTYKDSGKLFFDMGIVNDDNEKGYSAGLLKQKEELGCSVYSQDFYKMNLV